MYTNAGSWHGVELRHLAALEAIATEGSFSGAGVKMGYSQSAISGQIATLERLVGARLVTRLRGSRKVSLTDEGLRLLEHAKVINARLSAARVDLSSAKDAASTLRIGTFQSVSQTLLPGPLRELGRGSHPATALREHGSIENLVELVISGELDVTFVLLPVETDEVETIEIMRDPWTIVFRGDHPLARLGRPVRAIDVSHLPIITYESCRSQKFIEGSLRAAGAHVRVVTRLADYRSVLSMVEAGLGVGLVPRLAAESDLGTLKLLPLDDQPPRLVGLAWSKDRGASADVERFVELAAAAGRRISAAA